MNKNELIARISKETGVEPETVETVLSALKNTAKECVKNGTELKILGTGHLYTKTYGERASRNPKTGEAITAKETVKPVFKFSENFMEDK